MLGPEKVIFISIDDKARVKVGATAAQHQGAILMNMNHRIKLPDHDFVIAPRHCFMAPNHGTQTI